MHEDGDRPSLALPDAQDGLVAAVAAANSHAIVVLETGGPVSMPWADDVRGIVEAWYPGVGGSDALADLLFGSVNFSAKLPVSFARRDADLPEKPPLASPKKDGDDAVSQPYHGDDPMKPPKARKLRA